MRIFICRDSSFQRYVVNLLFRANQIDMALVEAGTSLADYKKERNIIKSFALRFLWGFRDFHETRILADSYKEFDEALPVTRVSNINNDEAIQHLKSLGPSLAIIHGTRIIKDKTLETLPDCLFLNIHWGLSPYYRGDGIITPCARGDWEKIGVTLHKISNSIDGGDIYAQQLINVDTLDNFYSIGLKMSKTAAHYLADGLAQVIANRSIHPEAQNLNKGTLCNSYFMKRHRHYMLIGLIRLKFFTLKTRLKKYIRTIGRFAKRATKFLLFIFQSRSKEHNPILLYHEISANPTTFAIENHLNVTPSNFEKQIRWITSNFQVLDPADLLSPEKISHSTQMRQALITFDDGSRSILESAVPILRKYGIRALLFLNAAPSFGQGFWSGLVCYLASRDLIFASKMRRKYGNNFFLSVTEDDIERHSVLAMLPTTKVKVAEYQGTFASIEEWIEVSDCLTIGNHLYDHYCATSVSEERLRSLYLENVNVLERMTNGAPNLFSYPFGQPESCYNNSTDAIMTELGATTVFYANRSANLSLSDQFLYRAAATDTYSHEYMKRLCSE